jgi:SOS response regulatory protein OraA/RecX
MTGSRRAAYLEGLTALARRELSEAQVRRLLSRRGHDRDSIESAVARLKDERAIDDARVAGAIARTETRVKRRGRIRVQHQIELAGIVRGVARQAVDEVFSAVDDDELLEAALARRFRGRERIADDREWQRLYRHLTGQGFEADRVMKALAARRRPR